MEATVEVAMEAVVVQVVVLLVHRHATTLPHHHLVVVAPAAVQVVAQVVAPAAAQVVAQVAVQVAVKTQRNHQHAQVVTIVVAEDVQISAVRLVRAHVLEPV